MANQKPLVIASGRPTQHDGTADTLVIGGPLTCTNFTATGTVDAKGAQKKAMSVCIEYPLNNEDVSIGFWNAAMTITEMRAVLVGSSTPSITWTIRHSTDRSATGNEVVTGGTTTTSTTTGSDVTSFNDATVPADSHVWLETTAKSGSVDSLVVTLIFGED